MSLLKPNILVSKLTRNCSAVCFLVPCIFEIAIQHETFDIVIMSPSALRRNGSQRRFFRMIDCV